MTRVSSNKSQRLSLLAGALAISGACGVACGQAQSGSNSQPGEAAPPKPPPLGHLSDPAQPASSVWSSLVEGKVTLENRLRYEWAETTGRSTSNAITNRLRLGYGTKPYTGFSLYAEMENVTALNDEWYWVPATRTGDPDRTTIADPEGTELNQAFARYQTAAVGEGGPSLDIRIGRQRIKHDDERFIGNIGWRQFEQTFDAAQFETDLGVSGLSVQYAYVWHVQRIFGPDGPNYESDSHFIRASYAFSPAIRVTPFAYFLDFDTDAPADSVDTFGARVTGELARNADDPKDTYFEYEFTYARQSDAGKNPVDYDANFLAAQVRVHRKGLGALHGGYQMLGSDDGTAAFRFPLGTNHKFQGYADQFLVTPAFGLHDFYVGVTGDLPESFKFELTGHQFWSDEDSDDLGFELDAVLSKKLNANWSVLMKAAHFDGHSGQPDLSRLWLETTFAF